MKRERGFYMHVNAEIIFYGGTDPDATVWVDGKEIKLSPDGTFRYHFTLPDGDFAIPIVARSPDDVEQRSATLALPAARAKTATSATRVSRRTSRRSSGGAESSQGAAVRSLARAQEWHRLRAL